jgi:hypothetical protein
VGNPAHPARKAVALAVGCLIAAMVAGMGAGPSFAACADPFKLKAETGSFDFKQTRRLATMKTPLISTGVAAVKPGRVDWRVVKPVDVRLSITPGKITQSVQGGPAQAVGPASADPFLRSSGLFEILTGNYDALKRYYTISGAPAPGASWKLALKPKDANLGRFLSSIEIAGCGRAEAVTIRQANGDTIAIEMGAVRKG